jgi:tRNA(fMet)-specific endonuclease VapC
VSYLFDTDALSETFRLRPAERFAAWLATVPADDQFASAVSIGELYRGAFRSPNRERWLDRIDYDLLPRLVVLPYDTPIARIYGEIRARMEADGRMPGEADLQIAATALHHGLSVVTGNVRHFERVPGLRVERVLAEAR